MCETVVVTPDKRHALLLTVAANKHFNAVPGALQSITCARTITPGLGTVKCGLFCALCSI